MRYEYICKSCSEVFEQSFPMGEAKLTVCCPNCQSDSSRNFSSMSFVLKGGGFPSQDMKFNKEMTQRNTDAAIRQKGRTPPVRLSALDYGGGDVRETK